MQFTIKTQTVLTTDSLLKNISGVVLRSKRFAKQTDTINGHLFVDFVSKSRA